MLMRKTFAVLLCAAASLALSDRADAAAKTIKVGLAVPTTDAMYLGWEAFKQYIEKKGDGSLKVDIYPNSQLGSGDRELNEAAQFGDVTCASGSTSPLATLVPDLLVLDVPFSFMNRDAVFAALDGELGDALRKSIAAKGLITPKFWGNGFRNVTNNRRPIRTPDDLDGLKLRTMENPLQIAAWRAMGANPTPMAFGEVFTALQQGTVDGQENPYTLIVNMRFYEVQKYLTTTQHVYTAVAPVCNKAFYDGLTTAQKTLFGEAFDEATRVQRSMLLKLEQDSVAVIAKAGTQIIDLTDTERMAFRKGTPAALALAKQRVSPEVFAAYQKATGVK